MAPTFLDLKVVQLLAPFQAKPFLVDTIDTLSRNALANGFIYAAALFLFWHFSETHHRGRAQEAMLVIFMGTLFGALSSLLLQQVIRWPPPAFYPPLRSLYALHFPLGPNANSFPSDSAILYSTVAFGLATWNRTVSRALLGWLLIFIEPIKIFVGGHYPSDIVAGVLVGFCSLQVAKALIRPQPRLGSLVGSQEIVSQLILFLWLFEVGNEFRDVSGLLHNALHSKL